MIGRTQAHLAATACVLWIGACSNPDEQTDLRPSGAPEVLTVLVSNDAAGDGILEGATFCKVNDDKRPTLVPANPDGPAQVCPDDPSKGATKVEDAVPLGWYVRIQFDELLNPEIEDLLPIPNSDLMQGSLARTQPVVLTCAGANVPYDGYYDPSGNSFTWPLGPSLFIQPTDDTTIPTGADCTVMIKDVVVDKDGEKVPGAQAGPFTFSIAPLDLVGTDPAPPRDAAKPNTVAPEDPLVLSFNAQVDPASLDPAKVTIQEATDCDGTGAVTKPAVVKEHVINDMGDVDKTSIEISDGMAPTDLAFDDSPDPMNPKVYVITFAADAQVKQDIPTGGVVDLPVAEKLSICFKTDKKAP